VATTFLVGQLVVQSHFVGMMLQHLATLTSRILVDTSVDSHYFY